MKHSVENNTLTVFLDKRVDITNADQFEQELFAAVADAPAGKIVLDASALEYISSAGLRVLLKLRKQTAGGVSMVHVNPVVFAIFKAAGFTKILDVQPENPGAAEDWSSGNAKIDVVVNVK